MKKKLLDLALRLDAANKASAREQSIRYGQPLKSV